MVTNSDFASELNKIRGELAHVTPERFILIDGHQDGYQNYHALTAVSPETEPPTTDIHEEDPYNIIYSSGTTGLPKGIIHIHAIRADVQTNEDGSVKALPNCQYKAVPGNHMTMLFGDNAETIAQAIMTFLEETGD